MQNEEIISDYRLYQNYPNPFNPSTTIKYSIADFSQVKLNIYNSLGERLADLIDQYQNPGTYTCRI
ncbi:MAG: hypothetical protein U5K00_01685 [Melioribacteraceae bacterium]|nr:hypothetical protein [Melioribacteraceae bacterium]